MSEEATTLPEEVKLSEEVKLPQEEEVKLPQEEEAKHPQEVRLGLHVSESQLACWGLGRGIKATEPKRLMQVVARPVPVDGTTTANRDSEPCVEETRVGTGYSELSFSVSSKAELTRKLSSTLSASFSKAVAFECGASYEKSTVESQTKIAVGHQIRNRTYAFRLHAYDEEKRTVDPVRRTFVEDCILNEYSEGMQSRDGDAKSRGRMPELTEPTHASVSACNRAIEGPLGGVTHFVAAIDMGGKVYREVTKSSTVSNTDNSTNISGTVQASRVAAKFRNDQGKSKTTYSKKERVILHPNIIGKPLKRDQTIKRDEEVVVCLRVLPISSLVSNPAWSKSMRIASRKFIEDELQRAPHLVDLTRPFYLKAGTSFVAAYASGEVSMTEIKDRATPLYIETLPRRQRRFPWQEKIDLLTTPGVLFLIAFEIRGQRFYLCTSSRRKYQARVSTHLADMSGGQFSLCHPGINKPMPLDSWLATGLLLQWKGGLFIHRYLQLMPDEKRASFLCRDDRSWEETGGVAQFQLVNAEKSEVVSELKDMPMQAPKIN